MLSHENLSTFGKLSTFEDAHSLSKMFNKNPKMLKPLIRAPSVKSTLYYSPKVTVGSPAVSLSPSS